MTAPLRLHYAPDNASLCVRLALEATGMAYATALVDRSVRAQDGAPYKAINPHGLIPALETPDGPVFETAAILLWLSERPGGEGLMPAPGTSARGAALAWLFWLSNTLHPTLRMLFYPHVHVPANGVPAFLEKTQMCLTGHFDRLEGFAATEAEVLRPGAPTAPVCYLCPMLRWPALYGTGATDRFDLSRWPHLHQIAKVTERTPWARAACAAEGMCNTPFSLPSLPNPPEGSAT